ncbi:molybdopterin synthase sulfur carrier subunit [Kordiimonas sediminis]|uniref:Molybdopterin synthase sulfur carrier subunit n=1 Tax=Kordiimonas sediminis TaxID=1735581 RepID=A0A919ARW3_9PROT|nr:molybdopterin converting factor subunit 1 [Kordiimonas sediminis]GHF23188.1 molybdopterin synthase sulfur carrier subunit [Kordiimonas sediminis]
MKILYFAWMRERIGTGEETLTKPETVHTIQDLITYLSTRGEGYAAAFEVHMLIRAAINEEHATLDSPVTDQDEIAFFPPVTGG